MTRNNPYDKIQQLVEKTYGARYRLRICGIVCLEKKILMVKNLGVGKKGFIWSPPGGEPRYGESIVDAIEREVYEETNILAKVQNFLFVSEFISKPFHAVELFFEMSPKSTKIIVGTDPELRGKQPGIGQVEWMNFESINKMPFDEKHGIFTKADEIGKMLGLRGFFRL
jgi:8-oxo-dGTP diphosphatase